jgi:DHHW motif protein
MQAKIKNLSVVRNIVYILPLLFIFTMLLLHLAMPEKTFSKEERRYLQQWPTFHVERVLDGSYETKIESYFSDQFPFRSFWVHIYTQTNPQHQKQGTDLTGGRVARMESAGYPLWKMTSSTPSAI